MNSGWGISYEISLRWMPLDLTDDQSTLVQVMAWCRQQGLTLSIWFTCPSGMWFWKFTCPAKVFTCPANICTTPVKLTYTAGKISTCPDWKNHLPNWARNHKSLCALRQDLYAPGIRARLNVEPWSGNKPLPEPMLTEIYVAKWRH